MTELNHRGIVVSLEPGDVIGMRLERTRTTYRAPLADVYRVLAQWHADSLRRIQHQNRTLAAWEKREKRKGII